MTDVKKGRSHIVVQFQQVVESSRVHTEPTSRDNFRSGLALDPDSMYDYCVQYTYTIHIYTSILNKLC
jgi:hypothetical protein